MKNSPSFLDRVAGLAVGTSLAVVGFLLIVLGLSFLPIIGLLVAMPVLGLSLHFLKAAVWVDVSRAEETVAPVVYKEMAV